MSPRFWQLECFAFDGGILRAKLIELKSYENEIAPPISVAGILITGHSLKARSSSERVTISFPKIIEVRVVPEICSWPTYEDGEQLIPSLLYRKSGLFFYGKDCSQDFEAFDSDLGWVKASHLQCYIIHSESFDIYVLSCESPTVS